MDPNTQTPIDSQQNQSEFATKEPFITPSTIKKLKVVGIIGCSTILLIVLGILIYNLIPKPTPNPEPINVVENKEETPTETQINPKIAYIKDQLAIWIVDNDGLNKELLLELSPVENLVFGTLDWKSINELSYTQCQNNDAGIISNCIVKTIELNTKSITEELTVEGGIKKFMWDKSASYIALIEVDSQINDKTSTHFKLKTGTILATLNSWNYLIDTSNINSTVFFTKDNKYVIYASKINVPVKNNPTTNGKVVYAPQNITEVFLLNGTKIDSIENAIDPFMVSEEEQTLGYTKEEQFMYRKIGETKETVITPFAGRNAQISPDGKEIAYWYTERNIGNVILGVYDSELNIHRNILRGIVLPKWISNDKILGIKADNCLSGNNCQLYEFQTNSLSIVDVSRGNVIQIDQGKNIKEATYKDFKNINAN